jgi:hypothetical protein
MRWAKIYLEASYRLYWILARSNRFIKLSRVALSFFYFMFKFMQHLLPNLDGSGSALSFCDPYARRIHALTRGSCASR